MLIVACKKNNSSQSPIIQQSTSFSTYDSDWEEIRKMENQGLAKSIIQKAESILQKALQENNSSQIFKALVYRSKYVHAVEEESSTKIISSFEEMIEKSSFPTTAILHSATADLYVQYHQSNRWRFSQRSNTQAYVSDDLSTWNLDQIMLKAWEHHQKALLNEEALLSYPTTAFYAILTPYSEDKNQKYGSLDNFPSLYEFLANRSLTFLKEQFQRQSESTYEESLDEINFFDLSDNFSHINLSQKDALSAELNSLKLYQNLLRLSAISKHEKARLYFNLERLKYAHSISKHEEKDSLYYNTLIDLENEKKWKQASLSEIKLAQAQFLIQQAYLYEWQDSSSHPYRWHMKKAFEICSQYEGDEGFAEQKLRQLKNQISTSQLHFQLEQTYPPNQAILFYLEYKNIDSLHFTLYRVSENFDLTNYSDFSSNISKLKGEENIREWDQILENPGDFQSHKTELFTQGLKHGKYYLVAESIQNEVVSLCSFKVSQLAFLSKQEPAKEEAIFLVRNRVNGDPIEGAKIELSKQSYNPKSRKVETQKVSVLKTDKNGEASYSTSKNESYTASVTYQTDTISNKHTYYYRHTFNNHKLRSLHFTDRAIYRPGQTIHLKGIWISEKGNNKQLLANQLANIKLYDPNNQEIESIKTQTNRYGSYEVRFVLPVNKLNGRFRIQDQHGSKYIQVEEYKRPSFEITIEELKSQFKIGQEVILNGNVSTYSGVPLSDLNLRFRVYRNASFPYWPYYNSYFPNSSTKEIAFGNVKSTSDGSFAISFKASEDPNLNSKWQAIYHYTIEVEASRLNGETQGAKKVIKIGKQALYLSSNLNKWNQLQEVKNLVIYAKNINGKLFNTSADFSLKKLQTNQHIRIPTYWDKIDIESLSEKERKNNFSHYLNGKSDELEDLKIDQEILSGRILCNQKVDAIGELGNGAYELEVSCEDKYGNLVKLKKRFIVFNKQSNNLTFSSFFTAKLLQESVEVGDTAEILISSGLQNLPLLYEVEFEGKTIEKKWLTLSKNQKLLSFSIQEEHQGKLHFHFTTVHSNRLINETKSINIPFRNKTLDIRLQSFRNLLEPGSKEKWSAEVRNHLDLGTEAEILASLYDQSLDAFAKDYWKTNLYSPSMQQLKWQSKGFSIVGSWSHSRGNKRYIDIWRNSPNFNWFGFHMGTYFARGNQLMLSAAPEADLQNKSASTIELSEVAKTTTDDSQNQNSNPSLRKNFEETAFFYPQIESNYDGKFSFEFQLPDALTKWKLRLLAHDTNMAFGYLDTSIIAQKSLMVEPNAPRFFREGDKMMFKASVRNLSQHSQDVKVSLRFYNLSNDKQIEIFSENGEDKKIFLKANENKRLSWEIEIPSKLQAIRYEIIAQSDKFLDGETKSIAVLGKRALVTESLPISLRDPGNFSFTFDRFLNQHSTSLKNKSFTFEYTSNPAWYVVQALPYLQNANEDNAEQVFHQFYANSIAHKIVSNNPRIEAIFNQWKLISPDAFLSKLEQNQALKSVILEETPWLEEAKSEAEQKRRIALLFSINQEKQNTSNAIQRLSELQLSNGGWPWLKGMRDSRYISQLILEGFGKLKKMSVDYSENEQLSKLLKKGIEYTDLRLKEDYEKLLYTNADLNKNHLNHIHVQALYLRSFFPEIPFQEGHEKAFKYFVSQSEQYWLNKPLYSQAMQALALHRLRPNSKVPHVILNSIREHAIEDEQLGMYWKSNTGGYYWYQANIETQALLIEAFADILHESKAVTEMQVWLIHQKRTQFWGNSKATAAACYSILMQGNISLASPSSPVIQIGNQQVDTKAEVEGLGLMKKSWSAENITKDMGRISIQKNNQQLSFAAAYWQYTEEFEKITQAETNELSIEKTLFKEVYTNEGVKIIPIEKTSLKVGDKVIVRLLIKSKLDLEFVHLKDQGASCFETINTVSSYHYQDGLGYYQSSKDASTNFYFDRLPKGSYVFEFGMRVNQEGDFSSGICKLQCFYAPEFSSHSKGRRVQTLALD